MIDYIVSKIYNGDSKSVLKVGALLQREGIHKDRNLDYTCAIFNDEGDVIATGSIFSNTLRCMAVDSRYQGEGLMNIIATHLIEQLYNRNINHLFVYTKCSTAKFFKDLGFYEIASIKDQIVFLENKADGFSSYLAELQKTKVEAPKVSCIVVNCNPFTLGHQYLIEHVSKNSDYVHLFIVSEDSSLFPFEARKKLILEGTAHLDNIIVHDSGAYIISNATFPSYFQKDEMSVIENHANIDVEIFTHIAKALSINARYVGHEPTSQVTNKYNEILNRKLPESNINVYIIERKMNQDSYISASTVRVAIQNDDFETLKTLVPKTTLDFLVSPEAEPIIKNIKMSASVVHH